jgi:hypothetical protein
MMGFQRFDPEQFRRKLMEYSDVELTKMGKAVSPAARRWKDPATIQDMEAKYEICKEEWRRRASEGERKRDLEDKCPALARQSHLSGNATYQELKQVRGESLTVQESGIEPNVCVILGQKKTTTRRQAEKTHYFGCLLKHMSGM